MLSNRWVPSQCCSQTKQYREKISAEPGFEPGAAGWEARNAQKFMLAHRPLPLRRVRGPGFDLDRLLPEVVRDLLVRHSGEGIQGLEKALVEKLEKTL